MEIKNKIAAILNTFDKNRNDLLIKRGFISMEILESAKLHLY